MKSDIEIAREANMQPIQTVAEKLDITGMNWIYMENIKQN